ncbi:MAG: radical SAM protein [Thermodesulfobacteriota bacterium]|nr:radical SAM protein [Thermodesulfobacteriota bacterium]
MNYEGLVIRPPSEANSLILQVTIGCSHNNCTFCPAYKAKRFRLKSLEDIMRDIDEASSYSPPPRRVFLADGDALIIPQEKLLAITHYLNEKLPKLQRIGIYGNVKSILRKSVDQLKALKADKLSIVYLGIESGDNETLKRVSKGTDYNTIVEAAQRVKAAGIKLSVTVLLGVAGVERSSIHAKETARLLTEIQPDFVGALTLMIMPEAPISTLVDEGTFSLPSPLQLLQELRTMIAETDLHSCLFFSNHASNYLPIRARLPKEKEKNVKLIDEVINSGDMALLKPEYLRAL